MILRVLLEEMYILSEVHEFNSGVAILQYLDEAAHDFSAGRYILLCDSNMGLESGQDVLGQVSSKIPSDSRYMVLMSGVAREEQEWKKQVFIDDFMEKQSMLEDSRKELERITTSAYSKFTNR